jgi:hypothetical protein
LALDGTAFTGRSQRANEVSYNTGDGIETRNDGIMEAEGGSQKEEGFLLTAEC